MFGHRKKKDPETPPQTRATERSRDALRKRRERQSARIVQVPPCADRERREQLEADDVAWLMWYFAPESGTQSPFTYEFTGQQREMIGIIDVAIREGGDQAMAASRGEGKSIIFERMVMKKTLQGKVSFPVLFGATGTAAQNSLQAIKDEFETNDRLLADYPEVCVPVRALENTPNRAHYQLVSGHRHDNGESYEAHCSKFSWCGREIVLPNVPGSPCALAIIATRGLDSAVRGLRKKGRRPDLAGIDDPDTENTARNPEAAKKLEDRIDKAIGGLGGQKRRIARVMLTTLQNRTCVSYKYTDSKQKPSWKGKRYRFLVQKPDRTDLWDEFVQLKIADWNAQPQTNSAHEFYLAHRATMDAGAVVSNPNRFTSGESSALEFYYSEVARLGLEAVLTEYENDPPEEEGAKRLVLSAYHIQTNCLSGLPKRHVPEGTVTLTRGGDLQKLGLHYVTIAWNEQASGSIIDYDFFEFMTEGRAAADCELAILEGLFAWHTAQQECPYIGPDGKPVFVDLTLIDMGWKEETWNTQPAQVFCGQVGFSEFMPSKGFSPYRRPHDSKKLVVGDNWHVAFPGGVPVVEMNSDHWKLKVHEGFLAEGGQPGSLTLFEPPRTDGRANRTAHLSFAKHMVAETWETRFKPGFKGKRTGWWKSPKPNHYFDATYQAIVARSMRGISVLSAPSTPSTPPTSAPADSVPPSRRRAPGPDGSPDLGRTRW